MPVLYKFKWPIIVIISGVIIRVIAVMMKILHWQGADMAIIISTVVVCAGLIFLAIKLVLAKNK